MTRGVIGLVTALAIAATPLLQGCSQGSAPEASGAITVWMKKQLLDSQNAAFAERAKAFEQETGVAVSLEIIAYEDFYGKWAAAIESGEVPDVSFFGYQEIGQFYAQGVLAPLTETMGAIETANGNISDNLAGPVTFDSEVYGIPYWSEAQVMYYRTDLLAEAGVSAPPSTWDEYRDVTAKLTDKAASVYGAGVGFSQKNSDAEFWARAIAWSYGGSLDAAPADYAGLEESTAQSVDYIKSLFDDGSVPPDALSWDDAGNNRAYLAGQAATVFNAGSLLATIQEENPELFGNTEVAPFPAGPDGAVSPGIMNTLGMFAAAKNPEGGKRFIEYVFDADWYDGWTSDAAPLTIPVYDDLRAKGVWTEGKNVAFAESVDGATFLGSPTTYSPAAGTLYNNRVVNKMFQDMLTNGVAPAQALAALRDEAAKAYGG
jgi:multiple sugar transport system substrate-binding protein